MDPPPVSRLASYSHTANISALSVNPDSRACVVTYSNNRVMELNLNTGKYTQFSREEAGQVCYQLRKIFLNQKLKYFPVPDCPSPGCPGALPSRTSSTLPATPTSS